MFVLTTSTLFDSCKKSDTQETPQVSAYQTEKDAYNQYEIGVILCKQNLESGAKLEGKVGQASVQIVVATDSTLAFVVLPTVFQTGQNELTFTLNGKPASVPVKVLASVLVASPTEEVNNFTNNQQSQILTIENMLAQDVQLTGNTDIASAISAAKSMTAEFKSDFDKLNVQDKIIIANFIAANKATFENLNSEINTMIATLTSDHGMLRRTGFCMEGTPVERYKCHWTFLYQKLKVVVTAGALSYLAASTIPATGLFGLGVAAVPVALAAPAMVAVVSVSAKLVYIHFKVTQLLVLNLVKDAQLRTNNNPAVFEKGISTSLPIKVRLRNIQTEDGNSGLSWLKIGMAMVNKYNALCEKFKVNKFKFLFGGVRSIETNPFKLSHITIKNITNPKVQFVALEGTLANPKIKFTTTESSEQLFSFDLVYNDEVNLPVSITVPSKVIIGCNFNTVVDIRDNQTYNIVQIGNQTWFAENLRYSGNIPYLPNNTQWFDNRTGAWCYYDNDANNDIPYGKLYKWYTIKNFNLCPSGWHVATDADWTILTTFLGGELVAGGKMKSTGTQYWQSPNAEATNSSCFLALPGGYRDLPGKFWDKGGGGSWWSSTETSELQASIRELNFGVGKIIKSSTTKDFGLSVRCVKD